MSGVSPVFGSIVPPKLRDPYLEGKVSHPDAYMRRRLLNWFPLGLAYAMLYMGRYNLTVAQGELGSLMTKADFGDIFGIGAIVYGVAFLFNGPLTDRIGGKRAMLLGLGGAFAANLCLGLYVRHALLVGAKAAEAKSIFTALYAANMYFQSFGAVAIVKVNASWFHVRERGGFSGIFGTMISSGLFFAFTVNDVILAALIPDPRPPGFVTPAWVVFFVPAAMLGIFFVIEAVLLKDWPSHAGHEDIETGDASSGEEHVHVPVFTLLGRILSNPVIMTVAAIEFCTGVLRNGVMHWFRIYAKEQAALPDASDAWSLTLWAWGVLLMVAGVIGGLVAGYVSDLLFQSRRAPAAGLFYGLVAACVAGMIFSLGNGWVLCSLVFLISLGVIGTHGLLSGTATMDFGGRKGAATAVGVIAGFVYLGTGLQSVALGKITSSPEYGWSYWPIFLLPFAVIGLILLGFIWNAMPKGKKSGGH